LGGVTADNIQIDPGMVADTAVPSGLQMNPLNNIDEIQIDPGTIVVSKLSNTPTAPGPGLQVKDQSNFFMG
jgi:hypothetical protein